MRIQEDTGGWLAGYMRIQEDTGGWPGWVHEDTRGWACGFRRLVWAAAVYHHHRCHQQKAMSSYPTPSTAQPNDRIHSLKTGSTAQRPDWTTSELAPRGLRVVHPVATC